MRVVHVFSPESLALLLGISEEAASTLFYVILGAMALGILLYALGPMLFRRWQNAPKEKQRKLRRIALIAVIALALLLVGGSVAGTLMNRVLPEKEAEQLMASGDYDGAIAAYVRLGLADKALQARIAKAQQLAAQGDTETAIPLLREMMYAPALAKTVADSAALTEAVFAEGSRVCFGSYTAKDKTETRLRWYVLRRDGDKALLFADSFGYFSNMDVWRKPFNWANSSIRHSLGEDGWMFTEMFSPAVRAAILPSALNNNDVSRVEGASSDRRYQTVEGEPTQDLLFLFSAEEAEQYGLTGLEDVWGSGGWWTRTMAEGSTASQMLYALPWADFHGEDGLISGEAWGTASGTDSISKSQLDIRPAMWVDVPELVKALAEDAAAK